MPFFEWQNILPTLMPLFELQNRFSTFGPNFRPLLPAFILSRKRYKHQYFTVDFIRIRIKKSTHNKEDCEQ